MGWPSFTKTETENTNLKFIGMVKSYPCIWKRNAPDYKRTRKMDKAWNEISKYIDDSAQNCRIRWAQIRKGYASSFNANRQISPYYLANALEFVRPYLKLDCLPRVEGSGKIDNGVDDSRSSMTDIDIKSEPDDFDSATAPTELDEQSLFDIIKMEDDAEDLHESEEASFTCNKRKREDKDSNQIDKTKEPKNEDKDLNPNSCLIEANRKFFESLIPFIDDMNKQQNRRFRREMMCLIDDVLDDRDINVAGNSSS